MRHSAQVNKATKLSATKREIKQKKKVRKSFFPFPVRSREPNKNNGKIEKSKVKFVELTGIKKVRETLRSEK